MNKLKIALIVAGVGLVLALGIMAAVITLTVGDPFKKDEPLQAIVVLSNNNGTSSPAISGLITFTQNSSSSPVEIRGQIRNLPPDSSHGFHIHEHGDVSKGCASTGAHFNPYNKSHGSPSDKLDQRHVGDLGNVVAGPDGVVDLDINDAVISLFEGPTSVLGRGVVLHELADDLGRGGDEGSRTTGNAGGRIACGVIGISDLKLV